MVIKISEQHTQHRMSSHMLRQEIIGNRKELRIERNDAHLRIVGNDNRVSVRINNGLVDVVGNSSRIKVIHNDGNVQYTGNCGRITIGSESGNTQVNYTGTGGRLKLVNADTMMSPKKKSPKTSPSSSDKDIPPQREKYGGSSSVKVTSQSGNIVINNTIFT